jgi:hypothetical protein
MKWRRVLCIPALNFAERAGVASKPVARRRDAFTSRELRAGKHATPDNAWDFEVRRQERDAVRKRMKEV